MYSRNRNFIGFETNREFYDKANKRIENELMIKQDSLFEMKVSG